MYIWLLDINTCHRFSLCGVCCCGGRPHDRPHANGPCRRRRTTTANEGHHQYRRTAQQPRASRPRRRRSAVTLIVQGNSGIWSIRALDRPASIWSCRSTSSTTVPRRGPPESPWRTPATFAQPQNGSSKEPDRKRIQLIYCQNQLVFW